MGDEPRMRKLCPDCGERLDIDARRCVCGWGVKAASRDQRQTLNVCTWHSGSLRCTYPVGRFDTGMTSGFCIFHRAKPDGASAARIADESSGHTPEQYLERAKAHVYGASPPPAVLELQKRVASVQGAGKVGLFAARLLPQRTEAPEVDAHIAEADQRMADINRLLAEASEQQEGVAHG